MMKLILGRSRSTALPSLLLRDERGLSTVEYVVLMAVVVVGAIGTWNDIGDKFKGALGSSKDEVLKLNVKESK